MIWDVIVAQSPALLIAIPLIFAFFCPFIGKISNTVRNIWVAVGMALTSAVALILAWDVYAFGTRITCSGTGGK